MDDLAAAVDGRLVVTSDHGNMLGERTWPIPLRVYGHPTGVRNGELVEVPWAVRESDDRREITEGAVGATSESEEGIVSKRLEHLGYA